MDNLLEWMYIYLPFAEVKIFIPALLLIGFAVGVISSFFGIGGAWMVTPGLNILGFPMTYAIGTDITHVAGKSIFATILHSKFGNVDYRLGITMIFGTVIGIEGGAQVIMYLKKLMIVDSIVRWAYAILLSLIGTFVLIDVLKKKKREKR